MIDRGCERKKVNDKASPDRQKTQEMDSDKGRPRCGERKRMASRFRKSSKDAKAQPVRSEQEDEAAKKKEARW